MMRFAKVRGGVTAHTHVGLQFRSRKPQSPAPGAVLKNRLMSFSLARSSLNMASYW